MSNLIDTYYKTVESSNLNATHLTNQFRTIFNDFGAKMAESGDESGQALLSLEKKCLDLKKSIEKELEPKMVWNDKDESGNDVEYIYPNHQDFGQEELEYFRKRYTETSNLFLKTEYGLLILLKGDLKRNDEKQQLSEQLIELVNFYWTEALEKPELWSRYMYIAFTRLMDAFLILKRAGKSLEEKFNSLIELIQTKLLEYPYNIESYFQFSTFVVNTFCEYSKDVKNKIDTDKILIKLEGAISSIDADNSQRTINTSKLILKFSSVFQLSPTTSYLELIAETFESLGDQDIEEERWIQATKNFEDALNYFDKAKNQDAIKRTKSKIEENKGKFPMASIPIEGSPERHERINNSIEDLLNKGDLVQLLLAIAGHGVFSKTEDLKKQAVESAKKRTLVNMISIQTSDKFGNTVRVYRTEEEKTIYHLFNSMNISSQISIQVIGSLLSGAIRRDILQYGHFEEILNISWFAKEIEWFNGGNTQKVKTLDAVLPGVKSFLNELTSAIKVEGYQPDFTCCTDSMTIKIEYILRHLCKHLKKPTFKFVFEGDTMLADEKPMSGLLIELEDFLREDDILWIKFLMNEKGGFNFRNRVCHGLVDGNEYGYTNALFAFVIILRLSHYNLDEE